MWCFNHQRLLEPLGHVPPAEFEEQSHRGLAAPFERREPAACATMPKGDRQWSTAPNDDDSGSPLRRDNPARKRRAPPVSYPPCATVVALLGALEPEIGLFSDTSVVV